MIAVSVNTGTCRPESPASSTERCKMPKRGSATFEQVGPTATSASELAILRRTEMPSSALQRSSSKVSSIMAMVPSPSLTPPWLFKCSTAACMTASVLTPNERTTPDLAPKPAIFTVRSAAAEGPLAPSSAAAATADRRLRVCFFMEIPPYPQGSTGPPHPRRYRGYRDWPESCRRACFDPIRMPCPLQPDPKAPRPKTAGPLDPPPGGPAPSHGRNGARPVP